MYGNPRAPSKDTILAARDRLVARYPKLRVIGCHLGSNEEDLGDREKTGRFVLKYQDRLLYATDFTLGAGDDERAARTLPATHGREWNFSLPASRFYRAIVRSKDWRCLKPCCAKSFARMPCAVCRGSLGKKHRTAEVNRFRSQYW